MMEQTEGVTEYYEYTVDIDCTTNQNEMSMSGVSRKSSLKRKRSPATLAKFSMKLRKRKRVRVQKPKGAAVAPGCERLTRSRVVKPEDSQACAERTTRVSSSVTPIKRQPSGP